MFFCVFSFNPLVFVSKVMSIVETIIRLVVAVMVTLVTDWSLLAMRVLLEVAAIEDLAEHHGLPVFVIGTETPKYDSRMSKTIVELFSRKQDTQRTF